MAMHGVAILAPIEMIEDQSLTYECYADDVNAAGSPESLRIPINFAVHFAIL